MISKEFKKEYERLNAEQKEAVDTIEGPVMVVAGPGTGKTQVLTLRIANILLKTDTAPENILALTFTDAAAVNMRRRLSSLIGSTAYRVVIETFHGFCNGIIENYPEYFPNIIGSANISEVESMALLEELIISLPLDLLRPWGEPLHYIRDILKKIDELKREGISPQEFIQILKNEEKTFKSRDDLYHNKGAYKGKMKGEHKDFEKQLVKNKELLIVYEAYQKALNKRRLYDWSDMIMEVLKKLEAKSLELRGKTNDLKLILQENHQYILVDEHQDTNNAQNKILELLCDFHRNPNIFIVGDEKQAIFRFQGASVENFMYVRKLYPKVKLIELSQNYRSGQNILDAAHSLISSKTALVSHSKDTSKIYIAEFKNKNNELFFVAGHIENLIKKGEAKSEEIAILYRSNGEAFAIADALQKRGLPFAIESKEDLLSEKFVRRLLFILNALHRFGEDEYLVPVMHIDEFDIAPLEAYRLINSASKERRSLYDLISKSKTPAILELYKKMKKWIKESKNDHLSQFLERILRESGLLQSMIASKDADAFLGIERLFGEAKKISANKPGAEFSDFIKYIEIVREHNLFIERPKYSVGSKIHLLTVHKAKGLEFKYVYMVNCTEKSFGPKAGRDHLKLLASVYSLGGNAGMENKNGAEDERRLFYVGLTRAKNSVTITYSAEDENGKEVLVSPFVLELREDRREKIDTQKIEQKISGNPEIMFSEGMPAKAAEIDRQFVTELFKSQTLSVSALNNYLDCPWKYFYRNLLRIPSVPEKHQVYGTAMHAAVEDLWKSLKDREADEKFILDSYKKHLGLLGILSPQEFKEALARGSHALSGWFKWAKPKISNPVITEFAVRGVEILPGVVLSGKIDKIEVVGQSRFVVTDYKTGKQKSRNEIEGLTKNSKGDMKRQLQFYKLLLELHSNIKMENGIIEFLEPDDSSKYKKEEFEISDKEVEELKETIKRVADEITSLSFWDKTCDDKTCEYCGYRKLLK